MTVARFKAVDDAVQEALKDLKRGVANRVLKEALAKVARRATRTAKGRLTKSRTGQLGKSLGVKYKAGKGGKAFSFVVAPRKGFKAVSGAGPDRRVDPRQYAHLVEKGRKEVRPVEKKAMAADGVLYGRRAKRVEPTPFVGPAFDELKATAPAFLKTEIPAGIQRIADKYKAKGKTVYVGPR